MATKNHVVNFFKLHGLAVRSDAAKYLCELLKPLPVEEHDGWIERVVEAVQRLPLNTALISTDIIHKAAKEVGTAQREDVDTLLQVIDIFKVPKLVYNIERKKFSLCHQDPKLHGQANDKAALFRNRYTIAYQRTSNHELFRKPVVGSQEQKFSLMKVEYLLGSSTLVEKVVVLGLLTQVVEPKFQLEDDTGTVQLDLTDTKFHHGLITHNCMVLVEGWYEDGLLHASTLGLPPPETASVSRAFLGNINYFGGRGDKCLKNDARLKQLETDHRDAMFVVLSDVWLDEVEVMSKLKILFSGYASFPPTAFILCGNFLSAAHGHQQVAELRRCLTALGNLIASFPGLSQSKFIFVPGQTDPGPGHILPRPPLPQVVTEEIQKKVPSAQFVSNPCRLLYCTQEIVVLRENIVSKMCRNCIYFPCDSDQIPTHFAKTLINQAHLTPLPLHVAPVYWPMDHTLALHPTPDLIITADKGDAFTTSFNHATIINPGSFPKTNFSFKVYMPATRQVEDSQIEEEET